MELEFHEDEVPEFQEALAARAARLAVRLAASAFAAAVVVHLAVRTAGAGAADRPEVVRGGEQHDPLRRHALRLPEPDGLLVLAEPEFRIACEDRDPELVRVDLHVIEHELPCEVDRAVLEVLAEREVAEHLEEREV